MRILVRFTTSRGMRCLAGAAVPCRGYPPSRPRSAAGTHIFGINLVFVPRKFNINDTSKSGQENMQQSSSCVHGGKQKKQLFFQSPRAGISFPHLLEKLHCNKSLQDFFCIYSPSLPRKRSHRIFVTNSFLFEVPVSSAASSTDQVQRAVFVLCAGALVQDAGGGGGAAGRGGGRGGRGGSAQAKALWKVREKKTLQIPSRFD